MPRGEQRAHQRLDVVAAHRRRRRARRRPPASSRWSAGIHATAAVVAVGDDGEAAQLAAARLAVPRRGDVERRRATPSSVAPTPPATRSSVTSATSCSRSSAREHDGRRPERLGEPLGERAELEEVEQPLDLVRVRLHHQRLGQLDRARRGAGSSPRGSCGPAPRARRATPAASGVCSSTWAKIPSSPPYVVDQLGRRLLADAGHAGQVVARVAAQRGVLRVLRRRHAGALDDAGLVVERVVADAAAVVEHLDVGVLDELVGVAVAGDDDDVVAAGRPPARWPWR